MSAPEALNAVLEQNLQALFTRSWQPTPPRAAFARALELAVQQRVDELYGARSARASAAARPTFAGRRRAFALAAAASLVALVALTAWWLPSERAQPRAEVEVEVAGPASPADEGRAAPPLANLERADLAAAPQRLAASSSEAAAQPPVAASAPPTAGQPATGQPATGQPATGQPATGQPATGTLEIRATDAQSGLPVTGYRAWIRREVPLPEVAMASPHSALGAASSLRVEELEPGPFSLCLEAPGRPALRLSGQRLAAGEQLALDIAWGAGGRVQGHVVERETGAPLANVLLIAELDQPHSILPIAQVEQRLGRLPLASTHTDAAGAFTLEPLSLGLHHLRASLDGYAPGWSGSFEVRAEETVELEPLELGPGARIRGRVEHADGSPWVGAKVIASHMLRDRVSPCFSYGEADTDADGEYRIEHLPPGYYVVLHIDRVAPDAEPESYAGPQRMQQVSLSEGAEGRVDFLAERRGARLFGRLLDAQGEPLAGTRLSANPLQGNSAERWRALVVDPEGRFDFSDLVPGAHALFAGHDFKVDMTRVGEVELRAGQELELELRLADTQLEGVVRHAPLASRPGFEQAAALANAELLFFGPEGDFSRYAGRTLGDAQGRYRVVGLAPGAYVCLASDPAGRFAMQLSGRLELTTGLPAAWSPTLEEGGCLTIEVVDPDGLPVANARVDLRRADGFVARTTAESATDEAGRYLAGGLPAGEWSVRVGEPSHGSARARWTSLPGARERIQLVLRQD